MLKMYPFPKKLLKIPPVLLCLMLGLNITWTEKPSRRQKILFQTIIYDAELSENYLSLRWRLNENLKPKSSMPLPSDSVALVEKLKKEHLQCYLLLNGLKATLPSLTTEFYGWRVIGNFNGVPIWKYQCSLVETNCCHLQQMAVKLS